MNIMISKIVKISSFDLPMHDMHICDYILEMNQIVTLGLFH